MRRLSLAAVVIILAACDHAPTAPNASRSPQAAPMSLSRALARIPGQYIVSFRSSVTDVEQGANRLAARHRGSVRHVYSAALRGAALNLPEAAVAALANDPDVEWIEADQVVTATRSESGTQLDPSWNLDRIDQGPLLPDDNSYSWASDGTGVTAYILDTGIRYTHSDFEGRASFGSDQIDTRRGTGEDCNGHGTSMASVVGGKTFGVAKKVQLVAVRVLGCSGSGSTSGVIAGIDWVTINRELPAVANMSLGGGYSYASNQAVQASIAAGVVYSISAGNAAVDACGVSPASAPSAITVGATNPGDGFATYSNWGTCVDMNAPGNAILSAAFTGDNDTRTGSGTSPAAAHLTGAAALYLSTNAGASPASVRAALVGNATQAIFFMGDGAGGQSEVSIPAGTPNLLLFTGGLDGLPPPVPQPVPPTASFTVSCSGFSCTFNASASQNATSYSWRFSDGTTGTGVSTVHTFTKGSSPTIVLTVRDDNGSGALASRTLKCTGARCS